MTKDIFSLADLDRQPEPTFQPMPVVPQALKRESTVVKVTVTFVLNAKAKWKTLV